MTDSPKSTLRHIALLDPIGGKGGMDIYNLELARSVIPHKVVVHYHACESSDNSELRGLNTYLSFQGLWTQKLKLVQGWLYLMGFVKAIRHTHRVGCELVHVHVFHFDILNLTVACLLSFFCKAKTVATVHDVNDFKGGVSNFWKRAILSKYDGLIVHNKFSSVVLEKSFRPSRFAVIPHGNFTRVASQFDYLDKKGLHLLFFGQIKKVKGLDLVLSALNDPHLENANVKLTIAGKPWHEDFAAYEKLIEPIASKVECDLNFIPEERAEQYFEEADVVVLPYREIFQSGVLMKAMSHGRVVIASDLEPFREIITHAENGFLFRSGDSEHLAEVIALASENRADFPEMAERSLAKMNADYDWIQIGKKTSEFYDAVIKTG